MPERHYTQDGHKVCSMCGADKPESEYYRRKKGWLYSECKACSRRMVSERQKMKAEDIREHHRRYYRAQRRTIEGWAREKATQYRYRARHKLAEGQFSEQEWIELCRKNDWKCVCCGLQKPLSVDHVAPLSKGGSNNILNIQPLCVSCNSRKRDTMVDYRIIV